MSVLLTNWASVIIRVQGGVLVKWCNSASWKLIRYFCCDVINCDNRVTWFLRHSTVCELTYCSTLASYKHGHITYLKRHLPSTFKICFSPYKSYKGIWLGLLSDLINQPLCFRKWISLCYVIHNNRNIYWVTNTTNSKGCPKRIKLLYAKVHHLDLIQAKSFTEPIYER